jgi:crotonobetainyl-CoA:carnitine CoA-transferase CaiB-like acyl-CoA transferase
VLRLFDEANVVAGPVLDIRGIFADPHYAARENIIAVPDDDFGSVRMQNVTPRFQKTPGRVRYSGRAIGADNHKIYLHELGLPQEEIARLQEEKVI